MQFQIKLNQNTILHYIEDIKSHYEGDDEIIDNYQLSFSFYDCQYYVGVSKKDIDEDDNWSLAMEGDSKLFDSFEDMCKNEIWELIKEKCREYDQWHKEFMS